MKSWEYQEHDDLDADQLNNIGDEGWELVAVIGERWSDRLSEGFRARFYFKRERVRRRGRAPGT